MTERVKMKYVSCPACGKQLFKVSGNCSVEITCSRCRKEIVGVVDEIYMRIFENCRGKNPGQEVSSRCSTDMEALRKQKRAIDTIKYNEPVDEPPDWAEAPDYGIWNYREPL